MFYCFMIMLYAESDFPLRRIALYQNISNITNYSGLILLKLKQ